MAITTISHNLADGEIFNHTGSVILEGNIGKWAAITIDKGGLLVKGTIGEGTVVKVKPGETIHGNITAGGIIIVNGNVVSGNSIQSHDQVPGLIVEGTIGNSVKLQCRTSIELKSNVGPKLSAQADTSFSAAEIGAEAVVHAGTSAEIKILGHHSEVDAGTGLNIQIVEDNCEINAGTSLNAGTLGNESTADAGTSANIQKVGDHCTVNVGTSANIGSVGKESHVDSGTSLTVDVAHKTAELDAGTRLKISRYSENDADTAVKPTATKPGLAKDTPVKPPLNFKKNDGFQF